MDAAAGAFVADPGAWADPALVAPVLGPGLHVETVQRLLASPRLGARASRCLADRLGRGEPATLDPTDLALASADTETFRQVAVSAGAVWHVRRVRALVLGTEIAALCEQLGEATRTMALRHAALAPDLAANPADDAATLVADIERDGRGCLAVWVMTIPDWVAARVRLKWPDAPPLPKAQAPTVVHLVRVLAAEVLAA